MYAGADGAFTLYEDAGEGYGYEKGEYALTGFSYSDSEGKLLISEREGTFPGLVSERRISLILHSADGSESEAGEVLYKGERLEIGL